MFDRLLSLVDFQRLAGIKTILGIDLTDERARVVEVRKRGNPLNRFKGKYKVVNFFTIDLPIEESPEQIARVFKEAISSRAVKSKHAAVSLQSTGVKTVLATVPCIEKEMDEWIIENTEKLLGFPISSDQLFYAYEILDKADTGNLVEITFVRRSEADQLNQLMRELGFQPIAMSAMDREALNALLLQNEMSLARDTIFVHCGNKVASMRLLQKGKVRASKTVRLEKNGESAYEQSLNGQLRERPQFILAGEVPNPWRKEGVVVFSPLELPPEYALAVGLAIKGFLPELSPFRFLPLHQEQENELRVYRSVFQRATIALGATLMLLLMIPSLLSIFLHSRLGAVDEKMLSSSASYAEVALLEKSVNELSAQLRSTSGGLIRTDVAGILHKTAKATPQEVWLYRISMNPGNMNDHELRINGYTDSNERVTEFLHSLEAFCDEVRLVRMGSPLQSENLLPTRRSRQQFTTFEIEAKTRR